VKDKFKQIGGKHYDKRTNELTLIQCLKLLKYIQDDLSAEDEEVKLFRMVYKFAKDVQKKDELIYRILDQEEKVRIDENVKEEKNKVIIKNILKALLDFDKLKEIVYDGKEISWTEIAKKIKILSPDDCRSKWSTIINMFHLNKRFEINNDLKLINK
jgi:hypothetical protein